MTLSAQALHKGMPNESEDGIRDVGMQYPGCVHVLQGALGETRICTQAQIVRQLHANTETVFVHRLTLNLLAQI